VPVNAEGRVVERLTGFGNREQLLADLAHVTGPTTLALFHLDGFHEYRDYFGRLQSDTVVVELADRLDRIVRTAGTCYRPREDEFAIVVGTPGAGGLVEAARAVLSEPGRYVSIEATVGTAALPDDTRDPLAALRLADERVSTANPRRPPRERRRTPRD